MLKQGQGPSRDLRTASHRRGGNRSFAHSRSRPLLILAGLALALVAGYLLTTQVVYADRVYPGVSVAGVRMDGFSRQEAAGALATASGRFALGEVILRDGAKEWRSSLGALGLRLDTEASVRQALQDGRGTSVLENLVDQFVGLREGHALAPILTSDGERRALLASVAREVDRPMVNASLVTHADGVVELTPAQVGRRLEVDEALRRIDQSAANLARTWSGIPAGFVVELPVSETKPQVVEAQLAAAKETAQRILRSPLTIAYGGESKKLGPAELAGMLTFREEEGKSVAGLDGKPLTQVVAGLAERLDRAPRDARFVYRAGKVQVASESQDGLQVDVPASVLAIQKQSLTDERTVTLAVKVLAPKVLSAEASTVAGDIKQKLVEASTVYGDTGADRQVNLRLATSRLDGVVLAPGETFSFNKALGPTTLKDGYRMAWGIISTPTGHETVPSEAGGICQVSTTLFQAALAGGYQIDQRTEHLYWMPRYGKPPLGKTGLDSTVDGSGSPDTLDFKFTNNTPNWLAIEARTDAMNLYFALWGTKPGWRVEIGEPVITNVVKTDPTVQRQYDETLRPGEEVWAEVAQDGFDVSVTRQVWDGSRLLERYVVKSKYRPANNVVRYGPTPVPTPTPAPGEQTKASPTPPPATTSAPPSATPGTMPTGTPGR